MLPECLCSVPRKGQYSGALCPECLVPVLALRTLLHNPGITSVNGAARLGDKHLAIASRTLHHYRVMLRESGAMRHMSADASRGQDRWVELLVQRVFDELPADLRLCVRPVTSATSGCLLQNSATECVNSIPVHIARSLLPQRLCVATQPLPKNASLGVFSYQSETVSLIAREVTRGISVTRNVTRRSMECPCGELHVEFSPACPVQKGETLVCNPPSTEGGLLVQFDGSCHSSSRAGGAGAALFELQADGLALINWQARGLHDCPDNVVAEAESAVLASELLTREILTQSGTYICREIYCR